MLCHIRQKIQVQKNPKSYSFDIHWEENLLQMAAQHLVEPQHLDDTEERATSRAYTQRLDVSNVVTALRSREVYHPPSRRTWILGIAVALAGLGTLCLIWFRNTNKYCSCMLQPKRTREASDQGLNECNIEFQVEPERSEESSEVTSGETPRNQSQPTVFVQHGRLVADHP